MRITKDLILYHLRKFIGLGVFGGIVYFIFRAHLRNGFQLDLYITEVAVALTVMALGILYWTFQPEIKKITERVREEEKESKKKHDSKKLNDNVFRKLIQVVCLEYYPFFENKFDFCIAKDPNLFTNISRADLAFNIHYDKLLNIEGLVDKMDDVIPTLEVGEDYLQQNYRQIYDMWIKIKEDLDEINKDRQDFCRKIAEKIRNDIKKQMKMSPTLLLDPFGDGWAYFSGNMSKIIPTLFNKFGLIDFSIENPVNNQFYLSYGGYNLMGINKKERLELSVIKEILRNIVDDDKSRQDHVDFQSRLVKLNEKIEAFCKQLEKKVVNDIDNQI